MKKGIFALAALLLSLSACELDNSTNENPQSQSEIVNGLKEALAVGTDTAAFNLSRIDGYFGDPLRKILLPAGIQRATQEFQNRNISLGFTSISGSTIYNGTTILGISIPGLKSQEDRLVEAINRAAESAAASSGPIFKAAITNMSIEDGAALLFSDVDTAATQYLRQKTYPQLFDQYEPQLDQALKSLTVNNQSVADEYESFVAQYNSTLAIGIPGFGSLGSLLNLQPVQVEDLSAYSTQRGLDGLFSYVAEEEQSIRQNPLARVTELLRRIFGMLD